MNTDTLLSLEEVREISNGVWASFLGTEDETPLLDAAEPLAPNVDGVHAWVGVGGAWDGQVWLEMTATGAEEATKAMLGLDEVTVEDVMDAVGELVNMVGGNIKGIMPAPSSLTLPTVVMGRVTRAVTLDGVELSRADLSWDGQPLRVSVWESTRTKNAPNGGEQ
ncbi:chemotaxis protein CheX [Nocardioides pakistanensis]